jgi:hypothetical protein
MAGDVGSEGKDAGGHARRHAEGRHQYVEGGARCVRELRNQRCVEWATNTGNICAAGYAVLCAGCPLVFLRKGMGRVVGREGRVVDRRNSIAPRLALTDVSHPPSESALRRRRSSSEYKEPI